MTLLSDTEKKLKEKIDSYGTWMYKFDFTDNVSSSVWRYDHMEAIDTRKKMIFSKLDKIFENRWNKINCLDVGCGEGHSSFELIKRGVRKVVAFDARPKNLEKAKFVRDYFGYHNIEFFVDDVDNIDPKKLGKFDLVFVLGLLYHVENPMLLLRKARAWTKNICVIETQVTRSKEKITTGYGLKGVEIDTFDTVGIVEEPKDNRAASITGLSFVANKSALLKMVKYAGFSNIEIIEPFSNAYETYANYDRIVLIAR